MTVPVGCLPASTAAQGVAHQSRPAASIACSGALGCRWKKCHTTWKPAAANGTDLDVQCLLLNACRAVLGACAKCHRDLQRMMGILRWRSAALEGVRHEQQAPELLRIIRSRTRQGVEGGARGGRLRGAEGALGRPALYGTAGIDHRSRQR